MPNLTPPTRSRSPTQSHEAIRNQYLIPTQVQQSHPTGRTRKWTQKRTPTPKTTHRINKNLHYGDSSAKKNPECFRIYFQNPDGLASANSYEQVDDICTSADGAEIDCLLLPETTTAWRDPVTQGLVRAQVRKTWRHTQFVCSASTCKSKTWYQPGGTRAIIRGKWGSRVSKSYQDKT